MNMEVVHPQNKKMASTRLAVIGNKAAFISWAEYTNP
jgi:hypothetical protein